MHSRTLKKIELILKRKQGTHKCYDAKKTETNKSIIDNNDGR